MESQTATNNNTPSLPLTSGFITTSTLTVPAQEVKQGWAWLRAHERIVLAVLVVTAVLWLGNRVIDWRANTDKLAAANAAQQLDAQKNANAQLAQQVNQVQQQYADLQKAISAQNAAILSAISARDAALTKQQQQDASLSTSDLAARWYQLVPTGNLSVTPNGVVADDVIAHATVAQLERLPVLQQNLDDETKIADGRQQEVDTANHAISGLNAQVSGLNAQLKDQDVACKTQLDAVKAADRKSKRNWFLRGLAVGTGVTLYIALHGI